MGNLKDVIPTIPHEYLPKNPCVTTTTELIIASCSNWGGFGLVAALSLREKRNLVPTVESGMQMVVECVKAGAVEGMSGESKEWVDNRNLEDDAVCLRDLQALLANEGL